MKTHVMFDPTHEMTQMARAMERLFEGYSAPGASARTIPLDILETDQALLIRAAVPGIQPGDLEVTIENRVMTLRGTTRSDTDLREAKLYRREIPVGEFTRSVRLPEKLDLNAVDATFDNGLVTVTLPKLPEAQPTTVRVRVREQATAEPLPSESATPGLDAPNT